VPNDFKFLAGTSNYRTASDGVNSFNPLYRIVATTNPGLMTDTLSPTCSIVHFPDITRSTIPSLSLRFTYPINSSSNSSEMQANMVRCIVAAAAGIDKESKNVAVQIHNIVFRMVFPKSDLTVASPC
jgi:hypothetical protein